MQVTINIKNADYPFDKRSTCHISLLLPENNAADKVAIETVFGNLSIKRLTANFVSLKPGPDNSLANIKADYFEIPIPDEADMNISNLDSKEINISLFAGSVNLSLLRIPKRESRIFSKLGNLNISFPKDESYTINARSFYSKFINKLNGSVTDWIREGKTYKHNGGGVGLCCRLIMVILKSGSNNIHINRNLAGYFLYVSYLFFEIKKGFRNLLEQSLSNLNAKKIDYSAIEYYSNAIILKPKYLINGKEFIGYGFLYTKDSKSDILFFLPYESSYSEKTLERILNSIKEKTNNI